MFTKMVEIKSFTALYIPQIIPYGILGLVTFIIIEWSIPEPPIQHETSVPIPNQADWKDYGPIFEQGTVGDWDYQLWGGFAGTAVKHDGTYYLYYQGASGYQLEPDETVTWRTIGVATSPDGVNFTKFDNNPVVTWFPTQDGEEGAASGAVTLDESGDIALVYGANTSVGPTSVHADGRLATSVDGIAFSDMGIVLDHQDNNIWGSGDELFPVIAFQDSGQWFVYYIPNGSGTGRTLGVAWGSSLDNLNNSSGVMNGGTAVAAWGMGGSAKVDTDMYALFISDVTQAKTEVRTVSLTNPEQASAPVATYQFPESTQATILLDEEANTWFMYYRGVEEYGLKLAPAGPADMTPPTAPNNITASPLNDREIELSWEPAIDPDTGIVLYHVFRDGVQIAAVKGWSYTDTGLVEQNNYSYEISAVNYHGTEGPKSAPLMVTTAVDSTPPQVVSVNAGSNPNQVTVVFNEPVADLSTDAATEYFGIHHDVTVTDASLTADLQTALLTTTNHLDNNYRLTVAGLPDRAITPNPIESPSQVNYIYTGIDGLVGAWSFDEGLCVTNEGHVSQIAFDTSNFGNDGVLFSLHKLGPLSVSGFIGKALKFDGVNNHVIIDDSHSLENVTDSSHSFAAWVYADSIPPATTANDTTYSILVRNYTGLYYDADQKFRAEIELLDGARVAVSSDTFNPGEWHHLAMAVDDSSQELRLYVDGQEVANSPASYSGSLADHGDAPYYIGTSEPLTNRYEYRFSGMIDETRVYNRSLLPEDVEALFTWFPVYPIPLSCTYLSFVQKDSDQN